MERLLERVVTRDDRPLGTARTAPDRVVGAKNLPLLKGAAFEAETLYDRAAAQTVFEAVAAFHRAHSQAVVLAPPDQPPN